MAATIVVVAKCPIPGKSKTRLVPLLGEEGSAILAKAMLCDVLLSLSTSKELDRANKVLLYAPPTDEGLKIMQGILREQGVETKWRLIPMLDQSLVASDLGMQLTTVTLRLREESNKSIIFLGMDSPELPIEEIIQATKHGNNEALLCPSNDGGYGMLSIPFQADPLKTFQIRWSDPLTAVSQIKALTDQAIVVRLGRLMHDMDEPDDVHQLCQRLSTPLQDDNSTGDDVLLKSSTGGLAQTGACEQTKTALKELNIS